MASPHKALIKRCLNKDLHAQKELYHLFAPKMLAVCYRYAYDQLEAEDILQEGFIKVFSQLHKYLHKGSLEGWIRRIMVHTAIDHVRKERKFRFQLQIDEVETDTIMEKEWDQLYFEDITKLIQELPDGFRIVFNLYAIEGYSHKEIAKKLNITSSTSRSQYARARSLLQQKIKDQLIDNKTYRNVR